MKNAYNIYYYNQQNIAPEMWNYEERQKQNHNFQMAYNTNLEENALSNENC